MNLRSEYPLHVVPLVFFDLETTGLRPDRGARISEMAVIDEHGIGFDWTADAGSPTDEAVAEQLPRLAGHLEGGVVVGHNLQFDFRFLTYEAERLGHEGINVRFVDTLGLARSLMPKRDDYALGALLAAFDAATEEELHTAVGDALATRALFWHLVDAGDLETLADVDVKRLTWNVG